MQGRPQLSRRRNTSSLTLFVLKMMHHRADTIDADVSVLGFAISQPPVQTFNRLNDHRFRRNPDAYLAELEEMACQQALPT